MPYVHRVAGWRSLVLLSIVLTPRLLAQISYTGMVTFPATTATSTLHCESSYTVAGPGGAGSVILTRGQFIVDHGTVLWATENFGFSGCVNFMSIGFSPRATSVSFELRNLSGLPD